MKIERMAIQSCCGTSAVALKLGSVISKDFLPLLISKGFIAPSHYTKAGIFYVENEGIIASGAFGSNLLNIKCRINKDNCQKYINSFEELLGTMG